MGVRQDNAERPGQAARTPRSRVFAGAAALLLSGALMAGCTGSSGSLAKNKPARSAQSAALSGCLVPPASSCYAPRQFRVAYGIQPFLGQGVDGRGETVTVIAPHPLTNAQVDPSPNVPVAQSASAAAAPPANAGPPSTDIRRDLAAFDSMFRLPAARIQVVTTLAESASPWQASGEEAQDLEVVHSVALAATLRVVLLPPASWTAQRPRPRTCSPRQVPPGLPRRHDRENLTLGPVSYTYHAGPGWDPVTGWGSPNAQVLIALLARG